MATRRDRYETKNLRRESSGRGKPVTRIIGGIIRAARLQQRLSQDQVAALSMGHAGGVSRTLISAIERGRSLPGIAALVSLSRVLGIDPLEILERIDVATAAPADVALLSPNELVERGKLSFRAGDYRAALALFDVAAERVASGRDEGPDARLLSAWIEIQRSVALRRLLAFKAARAAVERAVELAKESSEVRAEAYMVLASILSQEGLHVLARDAAERALAGVEGSSPTRQCQAWAQLGGALLRAGESEEALRAYLRAREHAARALDGRERNKIEGNIGSCFVVLGRRRRAAAQFRKALEIARACGDCSMEASWLVALGRLAYDDRRFAEARQHADAALHIARPLDHRLTMFRAEWVLHRVTLACDPAARDRRRLALLRRLWRSLSDCRGIDEIREFEELVMQQAGNQEGVP